MATPSDPPGPLYPELMTITLDKDGPSEHGPAPDAEDPEDPEEYYDEQEGGSVGSDAGRDIVDIEELDDELPPGEAYGSDEEQAGGDGRDSPDLDYDGPVRGDDGDEIDEYDEYDEDNIGHGAQGGGDGSGSDDWDDDDDGWELRGGAHAIGFSPPSDDEDTYSPVPPDVDDDDDDGDAGSDVEDTVRLIDADAARKELANMHPTLLVPTDDEVDALALVVRDSDGNIIDENHSRTFPWMSRFERAGILGTRATQLSHGAPPQISVPDGVIDSAAIASMELEQGQIPLIVRRPLPDGTSEYWPVHELEQIM